MNILYVTALPGLISAGPSWSVPASISAQSKLDNCLWVNMTDKHLDHWSNVSCYHNIKDFGSKFDLSILPYPFNHPDLVVFEDFYEIQPPLIAIKLRKAGIPYIIVPRGALTYKAQNNQSKWKKKIANLFLFKNYVKKALAVQFLTKNEKNDTGNSWNDSSFILPNGFNIPKVKKEHFSNGCINATFIGRLDVFHKGIDILIQACAELAHELRDANFKLSIYGPENADYAVIKSMIDNYSVAEIITLKGEVSGHRKEEVLLNSDIFFLTSRFEGHPMGLVEALAYGIPALVTPGTNMSEEIANADAGWVCHNVSKDAIKLQLKNMLNEQFKLSMKGRNAAEMAKDYDWNSLAIKFHKKAESLLTKTRIL